MCYKNSTLIKGETWWVDAIIQELQGPKYLWLEPAMYIEW